jgi:hypothetical protein
MRNSQNPKYAAIAHALWIDNVDFSAQPISPAAFDAWLDAKPASDLDKVVLAYS